jgi:hypothetical protein
MYNSGDCVLVKPRQMASLQITQSPLFSRNKTTPLHSLPRRCRFWSSGSRACIPVTASTQVPVRCVRSHNKQETRVQRSQHNTGGYLSCRFCRNNTCLCAVRGQQHCTVYCRQNTIYSVSHSAERKSTRHIGARGTSSQRNTAASKQTESSATAYPQQRSYLQAGLDLLLELLDFGVELGARGGLSLTGRLHVFTARVFWGKTWAAQTIRDIARHVGAVTKSK